MPWWIPAAIQGGASLAKFFTRRKTPGFGDTAYGKELQRQSREGMLNPAARSRIVGRAASTAGNVAQTQKSDIRGYLTARGMGNSIAGTRALAEPDMARMRTVSDTAADVEAQNEISKSQARMTYAQARYQHGEQARTERNAATGELLGGLAQAGITAYAANRGQTMQTDQNSILAEAQKLMDAGDEDGALNLLLMYQANYGKK